MLIEIILSVSLAVNAFLLTGAYIGHRQEKREETKKQVKGLILRFWKKQ